MQQLGTIQLAAWLADANRPKPLLLDVREPWEVALCAIEGSLPVPMHTVPVRCDEIDSARDVVVICHHGGRSMQVAMFLERKGYSSVFNLQGGVEAWACEVDPGMTRY
ncbi:rhodanese-like domain-containing protein [Azonexus sp.]|uniref:rhodanese-like domain-containing protein n=1 Tax=Azonexus sp. TaxID=1872668 RepID=UPI0027B9577B|nr:rhodanese-like domain-containing protein [Azonexus sp.]